MSVQLATRVIHVKDGNSYDTIDVMRGAQGTQGIKGDDGYSPTVSVTPYEDAETGDKGNAVTITDVNGAHTYYVPDGEKGEQGNPGQGVPSGGTTGQVLKKASNTNYDTEWVSDIDATDLAPAYSTSGTYAVGDYVTYNGDIYRCTTAISTAEAWTAAHWTRVAIGDELSSTKADINNKIDKPQTAGTSGQVLTSDGQGGQAWQTPSGGDVTDVQVNGTSVVSQGVANVPVAGNGVYGTVKITGSDGIIVASNGDLAISNATADVIKAGANRYRPITPLFQDTSTFYGLAKAAGDSTQSASSNAVGTYTDAAKKAIREMLGIPNMDSELINEITVAEDSASVTIDTDLNGQPYALRIAKIQLIMTQSTTGNADNVAASYKARLVDGTLGGWYDMPTQRMNVSTQSLITHEFESYNGLYFLRASSAREYGASSGNVITMYLNRMIKALEQIRYTQYNSNSTLIPAGSIIRVYGVRV